MTMRTLYHHTLLPTARKVRLALHEKRLDFTEVELDPWTPSDELLALNPAGDLPVLVDENDVVVSDTHAICEYLEEVYPTPNLLGRTPKDRLEARRRQVDADEIGLLARLELADPVVQPEHLCPFDGRHADHFDHRHRLP